GMVVLGTTSRIGYWVVVYNSGWDGTDWESVAWNGEPEGAEPPGTDITVEVRAADAMIDLAGKEFQVVENGIPLSEVKGRYIEIRVSLEAEACSSETPVLSDLAIQFSDVPLIANQETLYNNSFQTAHDLLLIIDPGAGGFPLANVITDSPFPSCTTWASDSTGLEYIHWYGATVAPGGSAKACFETYPRSSGKNRRYQWEIANKYWTDENGDIICKAGPALSPWWKYFTVEEGVECTAINCWVNWTGDGWPPSPIDSLGDPVGPISGTQVYYAITDSIRSMDELNDDLYTDPAITWYPLNDFTVDYGDSVTFDLRGRLNANHVMLLRYELSGAGLTAQDILQMPLAAMEPEAPTAVHLISFEAFERDGYMEVRWTTAAEIDNAGFNLYRSESEGGVKVRLNDALIPATGNELRGATYTFEDHGITAGGSYYYWFEDVGLSGDTRMGGFVLAERRDTPTAFSLAQNVPNPFNPVTEIRYALAVDCHVRLEIFNILGQKVKTLVDGNQKAGYQSARWDGTNSGGVDVSSGVYFYKLEAGGFTDTKKMVLLR
ncbi:MAG TPA: T9SS type A sorting domain-containing protein, partial [Patescibacteria group bacterium]|nr:T9SS type A sorting domain-containing protein [Patescibacteria group bacterium]